MEYSPEFTVFGKQDGVMLNYLDSQYVDLVFDLGGCSLLTDSVKVDLIIPGSCTPPLSMHLTY